MNLPKPPCYQCLIFPICKSKASTYKPKALTYKPYTSYTTYVQAIGLASILDCKLLYKYLRVSASSLQLCKSQRRLGVHYLTGIDVGDDSDIYGPPKVRPYTIEELYNICNITEEYKYGQ